MGRVGIVGAGPVGLMLSLYLARYGIKVTLYDGGDGPARTPRGSTHNARTMEHYRILGFARAAEAKGLPPGHSAGICFRERYGGRMLADADWTNAPTGGPEWRAQQSVASRSPERMLRANQCRVEPLLFDLARNSDRVDLRQGHTVREVTDGERAVTVVASTQDGRIYRETHDLVVGCDGARSLVREVLGATLRGDTALPQGVLGAGSTAAHVKVRGLEGQGESGQRRWANWVYNSDVAFNLISLDGCDEYSLLTGHFGGSAQPDQIRELITKHAPKNVQVDVVNVRRWEGGVALVADQYSNGRLFLAGDSAHLFTPHGGFGMNTGVDDTANLAWKLSAVLHGWAGPTLLDTYGQERRQVAVANTQRAREHGRRLASIPSAAPDTAELLHKYALDTMDTDDVAFGADYASSPLSTAVPSVSRAPHFWLSETGRGEGDSLWDRLGNGMTLLHWPKDEPSVRTAYRVARSMRVPLDAVPMTSKVVRDNYHGDYALLRPDGHLVWVGDTVNPYELHSVLSRACQRLGSDRV